MKKLLLFTLFLISLSLAADCELGKVQLNNTCVPINFIEGCYTYRIDGQCDQCEYGYDKDSNGACIINSNFNISQCCISRDINGFCSKCAQGLYLDKFNCRRNVIFGCITK